MVISETELRQRFERELNEAGLGAVIDYEVQPVLDRWGRSFGRASVH